MKTTRAALSFAALLTLSACGDSNPLIGEWELQAEGPLGGIVSGMANEDDRKIEFTSSSFIAGGETKSVTYEVKDDKTVIVRMEGEQPTTFTVVEINDKKCIAPAEMAALGIRYCEK